MEAANGLTWGCHTLVRKYEDDAAFRAGKYYAEIEKQGNLLLHAGGDRVLKLLGGLNSVTPLDSTRSRIGVGNGTTTPAASQTDLQGASKYFKLVDASGGFPKIVGSNPSTLQYSSIFGSSQANFAWEEWGIDNGTADGTTVGSLLLNRTTQTLGTKASGSTWTLTITLSLS